ncbi:adenylate kinase [Scytonema tolypothrichoides VB-61278]|nr:adenylate kinase [Scytonema tolypothrichoides VB-61278]
MKLVIIGGSGAGKSTQAQGLCTYFNIPLISSDEILRDAICAQRSSEAIAILYPEGFSPENSLPEISAGQDTANLLGHQRRFAIPSFPYLGHLPQSYMETGELVTNEMIIESIQIQLKKPDFKDGWVLEGYPRTADQAEKLDFLLNNLGHNLDWAIYLQVPQAVMVNRSMGRFLPDDLPEIVQRRVETFYDRTVPILEYYDRHRRLLTINGDQSPEAVQQNIITLLITSQ